ncbi:MAG: hypothetical protein HKN82_10770 [Akkermansiaceae bacterium]|nr:hypothetical protein [Akkermansiaceae bacterium]NNM28893.1 hypothetical protein [Akkermansiaceae bacterium]
MPYLKIQTNCQVPGPRQEALLGEASRLVSGHLGKDERYFMGALDDGQAMIFAGGSAPLAMVELKALGLPPEKLPDLCAALSGLVQQHLAIPPDRIYVTFQNVARGMWGWNGTLF